MMLVPRGGNFSLFDDFFNDDFFTRKDSGLMKTDIKEGKNNYIVEVDLPGFEKENINLKLNDGYLEISAKVSKNNDDSEGKYVRKERFYGECSRSFYIGDEITEEDIKAEFKNGILKIDIPKKEEQKKKNEEKFIEIK